MTTSAIKGQQFGALPLKEGESFTFTRRINTILWEDPLWRKDQHHIMLLK
jgi:hypothetical protein